MDDLSATRSLARVVRHALVVALGVVFFVLPLVATFLFSLHGKKNELGFSAYEHVFADPQFYSTFLFSLEMAFATVVLGLVLLLPTVLWMHLRAPRARALIEGFALLPFVVPPIVLVFGLIKLYSHPPLDLVTSPLLLVAGYIVISFPYLFRSLDAGVRALDLKSLTEASQSLGASMVTTLWRVIMPNLRTSLLGAGFLTFAIVLGELTLAVLLAWPAFGPYMALVGRDLAYEPAALAIVSFLLTWLFIGLLQLLTRTKGP